MVKAVLKSRPAKKEEVVALSKKSKSLEKKASKKKMVIKSPEAKKVSLALKGKNKKSKNKVFDNQTKAIAQSPEMEIKFKSNFSKKTQEKSQQSKANRFEEMKKIHKVLKEKKSMKAKREEEEDKDSDESADEDDAACKAYADMSFGEDEEAMDDSGDEEAEDKEEVKPSDKKNKAAKSKNKPNDKKDEATPKKEHSFLSDPAEQARTVLITNVSMETNRKQITKLMSTFGKVVSVRLRNLPVLGKYKGKKVVKLQVQKKQFKKEATSCSAYVKFELPEQATAALAANLTVLDNHHLFVVPVLSKTGEEKRRALAAGNQVVVGNLPFSMEPEPLFEEFSKCGEIVRVTLPRNKFGSCIGIAFVEFKSKDSVPAALKKNNVTLQGRDIRVQKAVKKVKKSKTDGAVNNSKDKTIRKNNSADKSNKKNNSNDNKKNKSSPSKKQGGKKHINKDELRKRTIARKLAAKK